MKIIIAPDSFKGNMSAPEVCSAVEAGILRADKKAKIYKAPLADLQGASGRRGRGNGKGGDGGRGGEIHGGNGSWSPGEKN